MYFKEEVQRRCNSVTKGIHSLINIQTCGSCGIRGVEAEIADIDGNEVMKENFCRMPLSALSILQHESMGSSDLDNTYGAYAKVFSLHRDGERLYHLNTSMVENGVVSICSSCRRALEREEIPQYSLEAGMDYGSLTSFSDEELPPLTAVERLLISPVISFVNVIKLTSERSSEAQSFFHGRVLCLPHSGRHVFARELPRADISNYISVTFTGSEEEWANARRRDMN